MNSKLLVAGAAGVFAVLMAFAALQGSSGTHVQAQGDDDQDSSASKPPSKAEGGSVLSGFMRKKLEASNQILEGLCVDDLNMVTEGADFLLRMSEAEQWRASNDMLYLQHSEDFRSAVKKLRGKAQEESLDGAALAWVDVTMSCLQCHDWVRDIILAQAPGATQSSEQDF